VAFLKDVESPYEVNDYVRSYLGDSSAASQFARDFLERRSRHKNQQRLQKEVRTTAVQRLTPGVSLCIRSLWR
jgi:hypothetical protein